MENVKGFDKDLARDQFVETLKELNYNYQVYKLFAIASLITSTNRIYNLKGVSSVSYSIWHTEFQIEVFPHC